MTDRTFFIDRAALYNAFANDRVVRQFETLQENVATSTEVSTAAIEATQTQRDATYVTLSANAELPNERVLAAGAGLSLDTTTAGQVVVRANLYSDDGWPVQIDAVGATTLQVPTSGIVATLGGVETFTNKTLNAPRVTGLTDAADDAAAATAGVPVGGVYRTGSTLKLRIV